MLFDLYSPAAQLSGKFLRDLSAVTVFAKKLVIEAAWKTGGGGG